jgi:hypothetical protein
MTMVSETTLTIPAGQVQMNMVRIGTAAPEEESTPSDAPDAEPEPVEPPSGPRLVLTDVQ